MTQALFYLDKINRVPGVRADFIGRVKGIPVDTDRESAVAALEPAHRAAVGGLGFSWGRLCRAEQVHGADVAVVRPGDEARVLPGVDGLVTAEAGVALGIYVADCGAVYIVDPVKRVLALLHSGKKGTEANITGKAVRMMRERYGSRPADLLVALGPCIRPPAYEVDFAAGIRGQALAAGVPADRFTDSGICTAAEPENYYSYRMEKGRTGRMLALLGMEG